MPAVDRASASSACQADQAPPGWTAGHSIFRDELLDSLLSRLGAVAAGAGLLLAIATSQISLGPWLIPLQVLAILLIVGGLAAVGAPMWKRGHGWIVNRGAPDLNVEPTGGPSPDLRLVVTNRGRKSDFHATAAVVAARNYQNRIRQGTYALMWLGLGSNNLPLDKGQSHALLLARFLIHNIPGARMGEAQLIECNGSQEAEWDGFRWNMEPNESLPEFDVHVTVVGRGRSESVTRSYTLRPSHWIGPLELIDR